ncbi:hypothetical protein [Pseudomonas sp. Kh13]|uniref:hypothetical protein n=1 Tax=Pseudomonas sp. Kh13 TaxID=2093744 RepID=UPI0034CE5D07
MIDLSNHQISQFAGNAIELSERDGRSARLVPLDVPTIEIAAGSVRCMIAGIHLSPGS